MASSSESPIARLFNPVLLAECGIPDGMLERLKEEPRATAILKGLQNAKVRNIPCDSNAESIVRRVTLDNVVFDSHSVMPSTIYFRKFYPTLLNCLLERKYTILSGNPGISKSWFHWYLLYRMVNKHEKIEVKVPQLIIRQVAQSELFFIFPEHCKVLSYDGDMIIARILPRITNNIRPDAALLLIEPDASLDEPVLTPIPTILTCSPDRRRYHEFAKMGAIKHYMPVWQLDELQVVAAHIRANTNDEFLMSALASEEIEERYSRFGGIFRYVIPPTYEALVAAQRDQDSILEQAKPADTFVWGSDIEKRDDMKENVSHFLLQYEVDEKTFKSFQMVTASEYVTKRLNEQDPSNAELYESIHRLKSMFRGGTKQRPNLFEYVVYHMLINSSFKWHVWKCDMSREDRDFKFTSGKLVAKFEKKVLKEMQPGILYRPCEPLFPAVEMLWVEENEKKERVYYGIQVTFSDSHKKNLSVYEGLYRLVGLHEKDKFIIYAVTNPIDIKTYAQDGWKKFLSKDSKKNCRYNLDFAVISAEKFDDINNRY